MQRGSDTHGPRVDEELKQETEGMLRSGGPAHAEDFRDPEAVDPEEQRDIDQEVARAVEEGRPE